MHGRRDHHRTVDRVAGLLEAAARAPRGARLTELAEIIGVPLSSAQGLVNGLVATGFLVEQDRRYSLGPAPHVLNLVAGRAVPWLSQRDLNELGAVARTPVLLAVRVGGSVVYVARGGPDEVPRLSFVADEHHPRPLLRTAAGRLLVALTDAAERRDLLRELAADAPDEVAEFLTVLPRIRATRIARSDGLADPEVVALALPVLQHRRVAGALVLLGHRHGANERRRLDAAAKRVLVALSRR